MEVNRYGIRNAVGSDRFTRLVPAFVVAALAIVCCVQTLGYRLVWDDEALLGLVRALDRKGGLPAVLRSEFLLGVPTGYYRPIPLGAFWLDDRLLSWLPDPFHLSNLLLHLAVTLLVLHFIRTVTGSGLAAFAGAAIFAVHPVHVESIAFVSGRTDLWAAFFCLAAAICCWRDLQGIARRPWISRCVGWVAATLAVLSKEASIALPLVVLASRLPLARQGTPPERKRLGVWVLGLALAVAVAMVIRVCWADVPFRKAPDFHGAGVPASIAARTRTMALTTLTYARLMVIPQPLKALYTGRDLQVTAAALVATALLLVLVTFVRGRCAKGSAGLALIWMAGFLAPVIVVQSTRWAPVAERFLYLPSVGYALLVGCGVAAVGQWRKALSPFFAAVAFVVAALAFVSVIQNRIWRDGETLFQHIIDSAPDSPEGYLNLGTVRMKQDRLQEAVALYRQALALRPDHIKALNNLGNAYYAQGRYGEALPPLAEAVRLRPDFTEAQESVGAALAALGRYTEAQAAWERAVALNGENAETRYNLGLCYLERGLDAEALREYLALQRLDRDLARRLGARLAEGRTKAGETQQATHGPALTGNSKNIE